MADPKAFTILAKNSGLTGQPADGTCGKWLLVGGERIHLAETLAELYNRAEFARYVGHKAINWRGNISVAPGGTNTVFSVTVGAIPSIGLLDTSSTGYRALINLAAQTLTLADVEGSPASLSNSSPYYIYVRDQGGTGLWQISTTAPVDIGGVRLLKTGDSRFRFLGAFMTNSAGEPIAYRRVNNRVLLRKGGDAVLAAMKVLTNGVATVNTAISVAGFVPSYVRRVMLHVACDNTAPAAGYVTIADGDDDTIAVGGVRVRTPDGSLIYDTIEVSLDDATQSFTYSTNNAATRANVWVIGWDE